MGSKLLLRFRLYPITSTGRIFHHLQPNYRGLSTMADQQKQQTQPKTYHKKATGEAQTTVQKRSQENDIKLFGSCFW
jgi:hypothetical protein